MDSEIWPNDEFEHVTARRYNSYVPPPSKPLDSLDQAEFEASWYRPADPQKITYEINDDVNIDADDRRIYQRNLSKNFAGMYPLSEIKTIREEENRKLIETQQRIVNASIQRMVDIKEGYARADTCVICLDAYPNIIYKPCNHQCVCSRCDYALYGSTVNPYQCPSCEVQPKKSVVVTESDVNMRDRARAIVEKIQTEADAKRAVTEVKS